MKNYLMPATRLCAFVMCCLLPWVSLSAQATVNCDCTEYLYINEETNGGRVHKYTITPGTGALTEIGTPWNSSTELPLPHGLAADINGFLYIAEDFANGDIRRVTCDGMVFDETIFEVTNGSGTANFGSVGNTLYTNTGNSFDLCTQTSGPTVALCGVTDPLTKWGFYVDPLTKEFYSAGGNNIFKYSAADYGTGTCVPPFITEAEIEANLPPSAGGNLNGSEDAVYGITTDPDGNIYIALWYNGNRSGLVMKFDADGNYIARIMDDTDDTSGFYAPRGIVYSFDANALYVSSSRANTDCITQINLALTTTVAAVGPTGTTSGGGSNASFGRAKAMAVLKECCPTAPPTLSVTYCLSPGSDPVYINELIRCDDAFPNGIVCEAQWVASAGNTSVVLDGCSRIPDTATPGCYEFTRTSTQSGLKQCPNFTQTVYLELISAPAISASGDQTVACGDLPADLTATTTGSIVRWERTTAACEAEQTWMAIPNTAGLTTYNPGVLSATTRFRAVIGETGTGDGMNCPGGTCEVASNCVTITTPTGCPECDLSIGSRENNCTDNGDGTFTTTYDLTISWANAPPGGITLSSTGDGTLSTMTISAADVMNDADSSILITYTVPADGFGLEQINAVFDNAAGCSTLLSFKAPVACPNDVPSCTGQMECIGGNAFNDVNCNGTNDSEDGFQGIQVEIYDCSNNLVGTGFTDADGDWQVCGLMDGADYRVEFVLPDLIDCYANPTHVGGDNGSDVQFVSAPGCADFGLSDPAYFTSMNATLVISCYVAGERTSIPSNANDAIVTFDLTSGSPTTSNTNSAYDQTTNRFTEAEFDLVGCTYGMAFQRSSRTLFAGAYFKRHVDLGQNGLGAIYATEIGPAPTSLFVDLAALGLNLGADPRPANNNFDTDYSAFALPGTVGLGDIDMDDNDREIWAMDLFNRQLLRIPVGPGVTPPTSLSQIGQYPVPDPGCNAAGDVRPFAVEIYEGKVYVGLVCSAESSQDTLDIQAHVYEFNPVTNQYSSAPVFSILDMAYERGCTVGPNLGPRGAYPCGGADVNGVERRSAGWFPWTSDPADYPRSGGDIGRGTPMLSDIKFDNDGNMILGFRDRAGDQVGWELPHPDPTFPNNIALEAQGDILLACSNNDGTWTLENNGSAGCATGTSMGVGNDSGPGGGEFFWGDGGNDPQATSGGGHPESALGGLVYAPNLDQVIITMINPLPFGGTDAFRDGGIRWLSMDDGSPQRAFRVYNGSSSEPNTFDKGAGLGDLELFYASPPLEVGNYVWCDDNANGTQEGCEAGVDGIVVQLFDDNGLLVGIDTTANGGQYYFNENNVDTTGVNADGSPTTAYTGLNYSSGYSIVFGSGQFSNGQFTTDMGDYGITIMNDVNTNANDNIDSDVNPNARNANGLPFIDFTTDAIGCADHRYDLGLQCQTVSVGSTIFEDVNNDGMQGAGESGIPNVLVVLYRDGGDGSNDGSDDTAIVTGADGILGTPDDTFGPDGIPGTADDGQPGMFTDAMGNYLFGGVAPGDYYVQVPAAAFAMGGGLADIPTSSSTANGFAGETDPDTDPTDGDDDGIQTGGQGTVTNSNIITLSADDEPTGEPAQGGAQDTTSALGLADANGNMTLDFGFFAPVSVGDTTFADLNADGLQDAGDLPLPGVTVTIFNADGTPVMTDADGIAYTNVTTTDANGAYQFDNLPPGDYYVVFNISTAPGSEFYAFTTNTGADSANNSDADPNTGQTANTGPLQSGDNFPDLDAGVVCIVTVEAGSLPSVCSTADLDLMATGASLMPDNIAGFGATWSAPRGDGSFPGGTDLSSATTYSPGAADLANGSVTLYLTSDDASAPPFNAVACGPVADSLTVTILRVDCGAFLWDGN